MRALIVNADDFGLSRGVNQGIVQAHRHGVVTSTSLMVNAEFCEEAVALSAQMPDLSVGLHADLDQLSSEHDSDHANWTDELKRQFARFHSLTGRWPAHIDSHHNIHTRNPDPFVEIARHHNVPLRGHSGATYVSDFYGQWDGETRLEQVSLEALELILCSHPEDELIELGCHPGYNDDTLRSSYGVEREAELRTLCDSRLRSLLARLGIVLLDSSKTPAQRQRSMMWSSYPRTK